MKYTVSFSAMVAILFLFPGCTRLIDWTKQSFNQGNTIAYDTSVPACYIRSIVVYDQLDTSARFDVLWLSDAVRSAYVDVYADRRGYGCEKKDALLQKQLSENNQCMVFYVLSPAEYILGDPVSDWTFFLSVGGECFEPVETKPIEMDPEYKLFFGKRFNRFKVATRVTFNACDCTEILLQIRSFSKTIQFNWGQE
jgi:hypothetical protein